MSIDVNSFYCDYTISTPISISKWTIQCLTIYLYFSTGKPGRIVCVTPAPTKESRDVWGKEEIPMEGIPSDVISGSDVTGGNIPEENCK